MSQHFGVQAYLLCFITLFILLTRNTLAEETNLLEWGPVTSDAQVSITLTDSTKEVKRNQPFGLSIRIKNLSTNETFSFIEPLSAAVSRFFSVVVISPSGKDISPVPYFGEGISAQVLKVSPNQTFDYKFDLSRVCRLQEFGTYKIIVKRLLTSNLDSREFVAISNPVYVTVIPGQWKSPVNGANVRFGNTNGF